MKKAKRLLSVLLVVLLIGNLLVSNVKAVEERPPKAKFVEAGAVHSFAIDENDYLWAWGGNSKGQLGDGSTNDRWSPVKVLSNVKAVYDFELTTFAIRNDDSLWAWGDNSKGLIGDGSTENKLSPVKILNDVKDFIIYEGNIFVIKKDGSLWAWGDNSYGLVGDGTTTDKNYPVKVAEDVEQFFPMYRCHYFIKKDGSLWMWGENYYSDGEYGYPLLVLSPEKILDGLSDLKKIQVSFNSCLALKNDGSLWAWGDYFAENEEGRTSLVKIMDDIVETAYGFDSWMDGFIKSDNTLWSIWNTSDTGSSFAPRKIMDDVSKRFGRYVIKTDGSLWAILDDRKIEVAKDVIDYRKGSYDANFALTSNGDLILWFDGFGRYIGETKKIASNVKELLIASGIDACHFEFIKNDNSLWAVDNPVLMSPATTSTAESDPKLFNGYLGFNDYRVTKIIDNFKQVSYGNGHTICLQQDGSIWTIGLNTNGQLGNLTNISTQYTYSLVTLRTVNSLLNVQVYDRDDHSPISGVEISINGLTKYTDENGETEILDLPFTTHNISFTKEGYYDYAREYEIRYVKDSLIIYLAKDVDKTKPYIQSIRLKGGYSFTELLWNRIYSKQEDNELFDIDVVVNWRGKKPKEIRLQQGSVYISSVNGRFSEIL